MQEHGGTKDRNFQQTWISDMVKNMRRLMLLEVKNSGVKEFREWEMATEEPTRVKFL